MIMPTLSLRLSQPVAEARRQALADLLTRITAEVLGKRPEVTLVMVDGFGPSRWFVGGGPPDRISFVLEIAVTQGTNTAAQKSAFVKAAYEGLRTLLAAEGEIDPVSYVHVRDVLATDWGYGGKTQLERRLAMPA
jgi:4-oxalocrotonate tautomerase